MSEAIERAIVVVLLFAAIVACSLTIDDCLSVVLAEDDPTEADVARAVQVLQPAHGPAVAAAWGSVIWEAAHEADLDPLLLVALAHRESSLREGVVGARGELGPMQLHGAALRHRPGRCDPREIDCSIRGGAAVLQWWRAECQEPSWSVWIGAYGLGRCPTVDEAEELRSVRRARELYERIGGARWE